MSWRLFQRDTANAPAATQAIKANPKFNPAVGIEGIMKLMGYDAMRALEQRLITMEECE